MRPRHLLLASSLLLTSTWAQAQGKSALAETSYNEGRDLFERGQVAAACAKFQASMDLDPQRSTLQALAVCREKEEKWASAWQNYLDLARQFSKDGMADKSELARAKATELEKKLLYLVVVMDDPPTGLSITIDGIAIQASMLGSRLPVDPGSHEIVATAPGKKTWTQKITVGPSPAEQQLKIAPLEEQETVDTGSQSQRYDLPGPVRREQGFWTSQRVVGAIVGGAGVLAMGGGAVFQIFALREDGKRKEFVSEAKRLDEPGTNDDGCAPTETCVNRTAAKSRKDAANNNQLTAIVMASAGGAMVLTGVILIATGGRKDSSPTSWKPKSAPKSLADFSVTPAVSPSYLGLSGTF